MKYGTIQEVNHSGSFSELSMIRIHRRVRDKQGTVGSSLPSWQLVSACLSSLRVSKLQAVCYMSEPTTRKGENLKPQDIH